MKKIWSYIETQNWLVATKYKVAFIILGIVFAVIGFIAWNVIKTFTLGTTDWMLCFTGYPVIFSFIFVFLYSSSHIFHDGANI